MRIVLCSLVLLVAMGVSGMASPQYWHSREYRDLIRQQSRERLRLRHEQQRIQRDILRERSQTRQRIRREADEYRREFRQLERMQRSFARRHRSV